ncbi:LANO_0A07272g1_1 [Lachancea nothofagi CBS 11611]|uniref:LANO_0A07272g1_1 n=1 Tax=Lachancea nothofagi CBS 11611 TaxID=1266666 RepID=A0A1G4IS57_9SACH|nr:LANO_0A07272g1_1 [Lachancea nothofagi CBS 11611]
MKDLRTSSNRVRHGLAVSTALLVITILVISMVFGITADRKTNQASTTRPKQANVEAVEWDSPQLPTFYPTCNGSDLEALQEAFQETLNVTAHARSRIMAYGSNDQIYQRWFGDGSIYTVLGTLEAVAEIPKEDALFRCDDIDGLCAANPNYYAGHHRSNATQETVICDYFYVAKLPASKMCSNGTVASVAPSKFMGIDMIHRLFHVPTMSLNEYIGEYTEDVDEILAMAKTNSSFAIRNVDSYLYYLYDVYSNVIQSGGCLGDIE